MENHPLPHLHKMVATLGKAKVFSTLDFTSAYHQIELDERSRDLTAFVTPNGACRVCRMPFGLNSASAVFQGVMSKLFCGLEGVKAFQDDVLIFSENLVSHLVILVRSWNAFKPAV